MAVPRPGERPGHEIKAGVGLTFNVPKAFWDAWCEQNAEAPFLVTKQVFAQPDRKSLVDQAKELRAERSGLEPLKPHSGKEGESADPRIPKNLWGKPAITTKTNDDE